MTIAQTIDSIEAWLSLGKRARFGDASIAVDVARGSGLRRSAAWTVPALGVAFAMLQLAWIKFGANGWAGDMGGMVARIFLVDYAVFAFALLSGWTVAWSWRSNSYAVEELSLGCLPPIAMGHVIVAGPVAIWGRLLLALAVIDMLTPTNLFAHLPGGAGRFAVGGYFTLSSIVGSVVLAWFHFESVRVGHWMFAIHALPRVPLGLAAGSNFVRMTLLVAVLSTVGSMATVPAAIAASIPIVMASGNDQAMQQFAAWFIGAIPGALLVIALKRRVVADYEKDFARRWLMYQWWGAGESRQPERYPPQFFPAAMLWDAFHRAEEEERLGLPVSRRRATMEYARRAARPGQAPATPAEPPPTYPGSPSASG